MDDVLVRPRSRGRFPALHLALFLATVASTLWAGFELSPLAAHAATLQNVVRGGLPFAASIVAILGAHEMGHYVVARRDALDIAAAGPLAGLAVALPLLVWGLAHSELREVFTAPVGSALVSPFALVRALVAGRPLVSGSAAA